MAADKPAKDPKAPEKEVTRRYRNPDFDDVLNFHEFMIEKNGQDPKNLKGSNETLKHAWRIYQDKNARKREKADVSA